MRPEGRVEVSAHRDQGGQARAGDHKINGPAALDTCAALALVLLVRSAAGQTTPTPGVVATSGRSCSHDRASGGVDGAKCRTTSKCR